MTFPDAPLTPEAQGFLDRILPKIREGIDELQRVPVGILIWGPDIDGSHPLAAARSKLRSTLRGRGHLAVFSEELCDESLPASVRVQQLIQARSLDLVVSIPASPGAVAEVHEFATDPRVTSKMLVFVNQEHIGGYSERSLRALSTVLTCQVEYYPIDEPYEVIERVTLEQVQRVRELKFMYGWRAGL